MDRIRQYFTLIILSLSFLGASAQEFNCKVMVMGDQVAGIDQKVFRTMEQDAMTFVNTRKWGNDAFDNKEKIEVVFTIILSKQIEGVEGGFQGRLSVQATRPVYNSTYTTTLINHTDKDLAIKYIQFQPYDFNDNRVSGNDPLASNLTAMLAYYCYIILGMDYDSFALKGGTEFLNKALNIVNNAPEHKAISGWKATEGQRNRFWLSDQLLNNRFAGMRDVVYKYHRLGLDLLSTEPEAARSQINSLFPILQQINSENPASMLMQFFITTKSEEIRNFMALSSMADKQKIIPMLVQIDVANAAKYAELLK
jgi:hypothetical protein